ncbi:hypothetical protein BDW62DRAFT_207041 [Aspergillus aurantiobrunneus]
MSYARTHPWLLGSQLRPLSPTSTEPAFGANLAQEVAKAFDEATPPVPYVFWGWGTVSLYQIKITFPNIDFVIHDDHIQRAIDTLIAAGYQICIDTECDEFHEDRARKFLSESLEERARSMPAPGELLYNRFHSVGAAHFHHESFVLTLHPQSEILFWLPEIKAGGPEEHDPDLMLSNDPTPSRCDGV